MDTNTGSTQVPPLHTVHINITAGCNLGCSFCYARAVRGRAEILPSDVFADLVRDCAALGVRRIILSGGEPLSRKDWQQLARRVSEAGIEVSIATNGTLITREVAEFLSSLQRVMLSVSIDGGEAFHDDIRGRKGAYRRTLQGIQFLRDLDVDFDVNAVIMRANICEIATLTKISRDFDCDVRLTLLHPNGRGEGMRNQVLMVEEILRIREYCHVLRQQRIKIIFNLPPLLQYLDEILPNRGAACGWATNFCGVLSNGEVTICGVAVNEPALIAGNLRSQSFKEIWGNSQLFKDTRSLNVKDLRGVCGRCPFNEYCGGACRLSAFRVFGDFLAPYEFCQMFYDAGYISDDLLTPDCS